MMWYCKITHNKNNKISVGCLPGKHLHKLLAFKTRQPVPMYFRLAGHAGIETLFVFYFFLSLFRR